MIVSVVVPLFNAEKTITKCIDSILSQTLPADKYEVIAVDDGSSDSTPDLIKHLPIRYIRQENRGPASARNRGAKEAKGDIILFTDSDCVPSKDWIEQMLKPFENTQISAVKGAYESPQKSLTARFCQVEFSERFEMLKKVEFIDMVDTYSAGFRRKIFWEAGGFDESFPAANNEDTDLSYKLSSAGHKMVFNPGAIVHHLGHPDSIVKYARTKFWRGYWRMVVYKRFPGKMIKDSYTPQSLKLQIVLIFGAVFFLVLSIAVKQSIYFFALLIAGFLLSAASFFFFALKEDFAVGILSPLYLALRATSIGSGVLYYYLTGRK